MFVKGPRAHAFLAVFVGIALSFISLIIGNDIAKLYLYYTTPNLSTSNLSSTVSNSPRTSSSSSSRYAIPLLCALTVLLLALLSMTISGTILDRAAIPRRNLRASFWASATFAPVGVSLRYILSFLNPCTSKFPIGTYLSNLFATLLDVSIITIILVHPSISSDARFFLAAIITGLAGSLSTVSTWISEAFAMDTLHRYTYVFVTSASSLLFGTLIYGTAYYIVH